MHEYSIVMALLDSVEREASARQARAVQQIRVRIGELAGVEPELLKSAFEMARERTICADAQLELVPVTARWSCPSCETVIAQGAPLHCASCQVPARLASGDEILLERIEMEVP
jgi:hydrogenase nickel incorporation protein HypA/HybF